MDNCTHVEDQLFGKIQRYAQTWVGEEHAFQRRRILSYKQAWADEMLARQHYREQYGRESIRSRPNSEEQSRPPSRAQSVGGWIRVRKR